VSDSEFLDFGGGIFNPNPEKTGLKGRKERPER